MKSSAENLPLHNLNSGESPLFIWDISHSNEYDFTQKHRHNYFEIIFFEKGRGKQLIDFQEYHLTDYTCYLIHPNQIHLLNRAPGSHGKLIQFRAESVMSPSLLSKLRERIWGGLGGIVFHDSEELYSNMIAILNQFNTDSETERNLHLLQVLLFDLLANSIDELEATSTDSGFNRFLQLVDAHFADQHSVQFYLSSLSISEKKLASLSKHHMGMSSLQVIHHRLVLEAKRLLLFGEESHKEIAYSLGFDSPASFSAFIKKKIGTTPSELQTQLEEIHK
jgi:AraC family transcriptional activator of pobA